MDIHEYQAKEILAKFGVPIPKGGLAYSPEQAAYRAREIGGSVWVVKAQVHTGGRGKAGGVKVCKTEHEVEEAADRMLGRRLVTHQSGPAGKMVNRLYVEGGVHIAKELYLGFVLDRSEQRVIVIGSTEGGMDIEEVAETKPESIVKISVEPAVGMQAFQARELAFKLGIPGSAVADATRVILGAYRCFRDKDSNMLEINPLVFTQEGQLIALDAKMSFDDNALFRHPDISELRDKSQEDPRETQAADRGLSYVGLDGDVGCIVNGAGLAMATMDMILLEGGAPANFLDIGGGATPERVAKAFRLVTQDKNVKVVLVNIFAGINRCDWVAQGVVKAVEIAGLELPLVVRLAGTNVEEGRRIIDESGINVISATTLAEAARLSVQAAKTGTAAAA
ncbi:malate--CoA ligase subunit beta [Oharaeibacter diazotrophicus]|uniref:Succinate--CoA ligase [ADP-forming] subunit beta n=1 Tax=Oharaeibacter diazotrophicus TaxID=1920512 RepID=A0A4R6RLV0_9HYPH|nr:malate--CoA ligase subunit beta [Oharaeibacter diazotrophicus]TDP86947.1 malate thiokinase large subunit [Oharaeibacter diazotrophicus]BBE71110.1 succinyl-CoA ligase [ADP-forming] subunit beta [Pleomorphomonas sp. SM30]GLS77863.1 succinate--CoA ligase [ADP-forming] subunit beta [Oharaeibacter diazotrophicus]